MDKVYLILNNCESFLVNSYEKLSKNKYKLFGQFEDGKTGYVIVSFPIWTLPKKHCSLEKLLETQYRILEVHSEDA